jgi:histidine ammonia-lyase
MMMYLDGSNLNCNMLHQIALGEQANITDHIALKMQENATTAIDSRGILEGKRRWLVGQKKSTSAQEHNVDLIRDFILGHCAGVGELLDPMLVRAAMAARANVLATGYCGARPIAVQKILEMLNKNVIPKVPSQGSVGAAGDLAPMAHIARALCGYCKDTYLDEPLDPTPKEALALINGVSLSAGISAIAVVRAKRLLHAAVVAAGLTMEVVKANSQCIDAKVLSLRGHPDVEPIGDALRSLLGDSKRVHAQQRPDAFSLRCGPSVMGAIRRTVLFAEEEVNHELNGTSDNPLHIDGEWFEAGHFHGASVAMAMDHLKTACAQLATLSERRTFRMTHGKLSQELPSFLVKGTGLNSGFMIAQYTAAALASEIKGLAHPASADSIPTVQHHEDHVSMAPISARMALNSLECLADIIAIELLLGAQALDLRWRDDNCEAPAPLRKLHKAIRQKVDFWEDDEVLHPAISALSHMVREGDIERICPLPQLFVS